MLLSAVRKRAVLFCAVLFSWSLISCSTSGEFFREVDVNVSAGKYAEAIGIVKENRIWYGDKSSVLYNLDIGLLFHYAGEPDSSIRYLFAAENEIDDLYTKSISQNVLSVFLNDNILPYDGEDFEKVLINVFLALDYVQKKMTDDALVEARKVDLKLKEYARKYEGKNTYQEDAFIRYIAGALYEAGGEVNDAFISYRKAYEAYQVYGKVYGTQTPSFLLDDLVRTATRLSFTEEADSYRSLGGSLFSPDADTMGSILAIIYSGKGPIKHEEKPKVTIPDTSGTLHTFQVAIPVFVPRVSGSISYEIALNSESDSATASSELAEDITAIAKKSLDDRIGLIYLKSGGRALLKFLASEKMKSEMNKGEDNKMRNILGSLAIDLVVGATEQADIRTWRTLPAVIQLARLFLPAGVYSLTARDSTGSPPFKEQTVTVAPRRISFIFIDDIR